MHGMWIASKSALQCGYSLSAQHFLKQRSARAPSSLISQTKKDLTLLQVRRMSIFDRDLSGIRGDTIPTKFQEELQEETTKQVPFFSRKEVAKHNKIDDCWIVIENKVYNVSNWIPHHPGGLYIMKNAGGESTKLFQQIPHRRWAYFKMKEFYVGNTEPMTFRKTNPSMPGHPYHLH